MAYDYEVTYNDIVQAVLHEYDSGSEFWGRVNNGTASAAEIYDAYSRLPQYYIQRSRDGLIMGTDWSQYLNKLTYADPSERTRLTEELNQMFSNSASADYGGGNSYNVMIPGSWGGNGSDGYTNQAGALVSGSASRLATIADKASLALVGVNIGAKLGAAIDSALYNINPEWWDANYPAINPQTWGSLVGENEFGKSFFRTLFGIRETGVTGYVDERVLAQTYQMLRDKGVFADGEGGGSGSYDGSTSQFPQPEITSVNISSNVITKVFDTASGSPFPGAAIIYYSDGPSPIYEYISQTSPTDYFTIQISLEPFTMYQQFISSSGESSTSSSVATNTDTTYNGTPYYYSIGSYFTNNGHATFTGIINNSPRITNGRQIATILLDGTITPPPSPVEGFRPIGQSYPYPPTNITGTTLDEVLRQLKQEYPDLFTDSITESVLQEDGTITDRTYVPIPWGITDLGDTPTTSDDITEDVKPDDFTEIVTHDPTTNPPDTGTGTQSPFAMPTGSGSSLWAVYHPSQAQLNAFGAWLWSSDFVEQLKKLFNDPMQAVIGVHKVFAPIPTGETRTIVCGYLDSGVASPIVSSQYTSIDCGSVNCGEYFGNVFDYDPHTKVSIYLPFIGVVPLKVSEVMRSSINVTYGVDVITGACLAKVKVTRDGGGAIMYSYGGSCACHYPISSGSYAGIVSGIVTSAIGIAGGIATGNPLAAISGAMAGLSQAHTEVQRSGGFTGCAGAMGPKKPYLIIDRPQTRMAMTYEDFQGDPANSTQFIKDCTGFIRAKEVHFSSPGAYDDEMREVETLLKSGIQTGAGSGVEPIAITEIES